MNPKELDGAPVATSGKAQSALSMEREAHRFRCEGKIDQAFQTYDQAAKLFQEAGEHLKAAGCFASAATCWNIHTGWQPLRNAATRNEFAAVQALAAGDAAYAETLFNEAALLYEKEGDYAKYSYCNVRGKDARLKRLWDAVILRRPARPAVIHLEEISWKDRPRAFLDFLLGGMNRLVWGYGERPFQTFVLAGVIIVISALFYYFSEEVLAEGLVQRIGLMDSLYMSVTTYTTVGYGDFLPLGGMRVIAALEALSGALLTPLFVVALARRYLRMNR